MSVTAVRPSSIANELGELAVRMSAVLMGADRGGSAVQILTSLSVNAVPNACGAGVTLCDPHGNVTSYAATSEVVLEADALQYHFDQGPCLDACRHGAPVRVPDLRLDRRWAAWTKAVRPLNIAALMSIPLISSGHVRGAIKIYCDLPGAFDEQSMGLFDELAQTVTPLLNPQNPLTH